MWRNTRRCFGWEQSDQGARWGWIFGSAALAFQQSDGEQRGRRNENGAASALGQARGGFKALLHRQDVHGAWPARSGERRRVADMRRQDPEPVGHGD